MARFCHESAKAGLRHTGSRVKDTAGLPMLVTDSIRVPAR